MLTRSASSTSKPETASDVSASEDIPEDIPVALSATDSTPPAEVRLSPPFPLAITTLLEEISSESQSVRSPPSGERKEHSLPDAEGAIRSRLLRLLAALHSTINVEFNLIHDLKIIWKSADPQSLFTALASVPTSALNSFFANPVDASFKLASGAAISTRFWNCIRACLHDLGLIEKLPHFASRTTHPDTHQSTGTEEDLILQVQKLQEWKNNELARNRIKAATTIATTTANLDKLRHSAYELDQMEATDALTAKQRKLYLNHLALTQAFDYLSLSAATLRDINSSLTLDVVKSWFYAHIRSFTTWLVIMNTSLSSTSNSASDSWTAEYLKIASSASFNFPAFHQLMLLEFSGESKLKSMAGILKSIHTSVLSKSEIEKAQLEAAIRTSSYSPLKADKKLLLAFRSAWSLLCVIIEFIYDHRAIASAMREFYTEVSRDLAFIAPHASGTFSNATSSMITVLNTYMLMFESCIRPLLRRSFASPLLSSTQNPKSGSGVKTSGSGHLSLRESSIATLTNPYSSRGRTLLTLLTSGGKYSHCLGNLDRVLTNLFDCFNEISKLPPVTKPITMPFSKQLGKQISTPQISTPNPKAQPLTFQAMIQAWPAGSAQITAGPGGTVYIDSSGNELGRCRFHCYGKNGPMSTQRNAGLGYNATVAFQCNVKDTVTVTGQVGVQSASGPTSLTPATFTCCKPRTGAGSGKLFVHA